MNIWDKYGMTRQDWIKLDWKIKRKYLYKSGYGNFWSYYFPTFSWFIKWIKLKYNEPKGGYLLDAYFKHNTMIENMIYNYPQLKYLRDWRK